MYALGFRRTGNVQTCPDSGPETLNRPCQETSWPKGEGGPCPNLRLGQPSLQVSSVSKGPAAATEKVPPGPEIFRFRWIQLEPRIRYVVSIAENRGLSVVHKAASHKHPLLQGSHASRRDRPSCYPDNRRALRLLRCCPLRTADADGSDENSTAKSPDGRQRPLAIRAGSQAAVGRAGRYELDRLAVSTGSPVPCAESAGGRRVGPSC